MVAGIPNPSTGFGTLKPIGTPQAFMVAGTYTVTPPAGTRAMRVELRGAGGFGGGQVSSGVGGGGGQGALVRKFLTGTGATPLQLVVGAKGKGATSTPATDTTFAGLRAAAGGGGLFGSGKFGGVGIGGAGADGAESTVGFGQFKGADGTGQKGGGTFGATDAGGVPTMGSGGGGASSRPEGSTGGDGSDGYARIEFYG